MVEVIQIIIVKCVSTYLIVFRLGSVEEHLTEIIQNKFKS